MTGALSLPYALTGRTAMIGSSELACDGVLDRVLGVGADVVLHVAEQDVITALLPADDAVADGRAAVAHAGPVFSIWVTQSISLPSRGRDLVEDLLVEPVDHEQPRGALCSFVTISSYGRMRRCGGPVRSGPRPPPSWPRRPCPRPAGPGPEPAAMPESRRKTASPGPCRATSSACLPRSSMSSMKKARNIPPSIQISQFDK